MDSPVDRWLQRFLVEVEEVQAHIATERARLEKRLASLADLDARLQAFVDWANGTVPPVSTAATHATLTIKGASMPGEINVDTTTGVATLTFLDDHGDVAEAPVGPDGLPVSVQFASSDETVLTVDLSSGVVTPLLVGTSDVSVTVTNTDGSPTLEPDGVTPFAPAPVSVPVVAGPAGTAVLAVTS